jgi:hypothetical protein
VGYIVGIFNDSRKREIEFTDQQIEKLYGPLFALSTASRRATKEILFHLRPGKTTFFDDHDPPSPQEVETWRRWMKTIFQPMNIRMEAAIVDNAQLIEGGHIYPVFAELILHVESYKGTIAKWKDTDAKENPHFTERSENVAVINFPKGFDGCVDSRFLAMREKREQLKNAWFLPLATVEDSKFPEDCR